MGGTDLWAVIQKVIIANDKTLLASKALKNVARNCVEQEVLVPLIVHSNNECLKYHSQRNRALCFLCSFSLTLRNPSEIYSRLKTVTSQR